MQRFPQDKDPQSPTDILGKPLEEGDQIAWASGKRLRIGTVERIRFKRRLIIGWNPDNTPSYSYGELEETHRGDPEIVRWSVTGRDARFTARRGRDARVQAVPDVQNIIKVEFDDEF